MTSREQQIKNIFQEALGYDPTERQHFLSKHCAGDPDLHARVEVLLRHHEEATGILDDPPDFAALGLAPLPERPRYEPGENLVGTDIGPYHLLDFLGQGGMGLVYLARQQEPVRRRVALKIVKSSSEAAEILSRFESERQALALMDHPCIARIFVADTTDDGRPFFTMEYVTGIPITEYCDSNQLSVSERARLFLRVCDGVQHAHQKGILHRDLKPSNILVAMRDQEPVPKIIDFGVAKALHQKLTESSVVTAHGFLVGTPDYMSPEQAASDGVDVDTRADIYSLGVLLYQLLCGVLPIDPHVLREGGSARIQERIINEEPPPPSRRLAREEGAPEIARNRRLQPRRLSRLLQHDLDWITMKALAKNRAERYPTVSDFAADILRFLVGEPVQAGPPNLTNRLRKFVRRYRVSLVAAAAVLLTLVGGLVASLNFAYRAEEAYEAADANARQALQSGLEAKKITEYMKSVLLIASPHRGGSPDMAICEALAAADEGLDNILTATPEINAVVRVTVAEIYHSLCMYDKALHHAGLAVDSLKRIPDPDFRDLAWGLRIMALANHDQGHISEAEALYREALAIYREKIGEDSPAVIAILTDLVNITTQSGGFQEAAASYRELIDQQERVIGVDSKEVGMTRMYLGNLLGGNAYYKEGMAQLERALAILEPKIGTGHRYTSMARYYLGLQYSRKNDFDAAVPLLQMAADSLRVHLEANHRLVLMAQRDLAAAWSGQRRFSRADSLFGYVLNQLHTEQGESSLAAGICFLYRGDNYQRQGNSVQAQQCYLDAEQITDRFFPDSGHPLKARIQQKMARLDQERGAHELARQRLEVSLQQYRDRLRPDHPRIIENLAALAHSLVELADYQAATPVAEEFFLSAVREFGADHAETEAAANLNLRLQERWQRPVEVDKWRNWLRGDRREVPVQAD